LHPNKAFHWTYEAEMLRFIAATGWSRIFITTPAGPRVAHAPVIVDHAARTLRFHLSRHNAVHDFVDGATGLALFEGPHAYVSANWYSEPEKQVPTWNYVAVECEGRVAAPSPDGLLPLLDALAAEHEPAVGESWSRAMSDPAAITAMLSAITLFELRITALRGTRKLSQNSPSEVVRLAAAVERSGVADAAALMRDSKP